MNWIISTFCKHWLFKIVLIYFVGLTNLSLAQDYQINDTLVIRNYSSSTYKASPVNFTGITLQNNNILIANDNGVLYIVKDTVIKINGELKVDSNYGVGSVFTLILNN